MQAVCAHVRTYKLEQSEYLLLENTVRHENLFASTWWKLDMCFWYQLCQSHRGNQMVSQSDSCLRETAQIGHVF